MYKTTALILLLLTGVCQAGIISYAGYERERHGTIIRGGGLEWLRWDQSVFTYASDVWDGTKFEGWRLATAEEMATTINAFGFAHFGTREIDSSWYNLGFTEGYDEAIFSFTQIFGVTHTISLQGPSHLPYQPMFIASALYGVDIDNDGRLPMISVGTSSYAYGDERDASARMGSDIWEVSWDRSYEYGLALVREPASEPPDQQVNESSSIGALAIGLLCLLYSKHRRAKVCNQYS